MVDVFEKLKEKTRKKPIPIKEPGALELYEEQFHSEFSVISFALGVISVVIPAFSIIAILLGIGGLMQVRREKMKGKWMALAGITLGFVGLLLVLLAVLFTIPALEILALSGERFFS